MTTLPCTAAGSNREGGIVNIRHGHRESIEYDYISVFFRLLSEGFLLTEVSGPSLSANFYIFRSFFRLFTDAMACRKSIQAVSAPLPPAEGKFLRPTQGAIISLQIVAG